jgi:hypothetical protein
MGKLGHFFKQSGDTNNYDYNNNAHNVNVSSNNKISTANSDYR